MKTFSLRKEDIKKDWFVVDAADVVLGRLAAVVATRLRGKHKPEYTPHTDCGDHIIVVNAEKVRVTGNPLLKMHYRHTGHPGGIKETNASEILLGKHPERLIQKAVKRMLPKDGPLTRDVFSNLRVYAGSEHPHVAQNPQTLDVAAMNPKNKRSN
jgi:large subunit ribosomal protein L13